MIRPPQSSLLLWADLAKVRRCQLRMSRRMLGAKSRPGEDWSDFLIRTASRIDSINASVQAPKWDIQILRQIFNWAGHVSRYGTHSPLELPFLLTCYRDGLYLDRRRAASRDGRHLYRGHRRKPWRWEHFLHQYFRVDSSGRLVSWQAYATDKSVWDSHREAWCRYRLSAASNLDL